MRNPFWRFSFKTLTSYSLNPFFNVKCSDEDCTTFHKWLLTSSFLWTTRSTRKSDSLWCWSLSAAQVRRWRTPARWSETSRERPESSNGVLSSVCRSNRHLLKAQSLLPLWFFIVISLREEKWLYDPLLAVYEHWPVITCFFDIKEMSQLFRTRERIIFHLQSVEICIEVIICEQLKKALCLKFNLVCKLRYIALCF